MRITLSVLKADVGFIGGHTEPSEKMLAATREAVEQFQLRDGREAAAETTGSAEAKSR